MSGHLRTQPNIAVPDDFYAALIEAHRGLTDALECGAQHPPHPPAHNHVGDINVLREALEAVRVGLA